MHIIWITGWSYCPSAIQIWANQCFNKHTHTVLTPTYDHFLNLEFTHADYFIGHSLGALILLKAFQENKNKNLKLNKTFYSIPSLLLAPFLSIELSHLSHKHIVHFLRLLDKDPIAGIQKFHTLIQNKFSLSNTLPYAIEDLKWGLHLLLETHKFSIPKTIQAFCGSQDPLLNAYKLKENYPNLTTLNNKGHCLLEFQSILYGLFQ